MRVSEVAHDIQQQVSRYIVSLGITNSYDTWHGKDVDIIVMHRIVKAMCSGTKNVAKQMLKISQGRVRDRGVTWFPELVDKSIIIDSVYVIPVVNCHEHLFRKEHQDPSLLVNEEQRGKCRLPEEPH